MFFFNLNFIKVSLSLLKCDLKYNCMCVYLFLAKRKPWTEEMLSALQTIVPEIEREKKPPQKESVEELKKEISMPGLKILATDKASGIFFIYR